MLLTHLLIVFSDLICAAIINVRPSLAGIRIIKILTFMTLASGSYLVVSRHASITGACLAGILFLGVVLASVFSARKRLAKQISVD
ncbi:MAG TPA: hypothetical protein VFP32_00085 [Candidatus Saccharimonadales bacterium]|nr:hypothetical protein [Candidatus Saccharimonadales bacterium]